MRKILLTLLLILSFNYCYPQTLGPPSPDKHIGSGPSFNDTDINDEITLPINIYIIIGLFIGGIYGVKSKRKVSKF